MITKVILVIFMSARYKGGPDHIEFKNMAQCMEFKHKIETSREFDSISIYCACIQSEVRH